MHNARQIPGHIAQSNPSTHSALFPLEATGADNAGTPALLAPAATAPLARNRLPLLDTWRGRQAGSTYQLSDNTTRKSLND
jgi:hypothetical protein